LLPFGPEPSVVLVAVKNLKNRIYKNIILPVVLYGCENWSLTLREEHRLEVLENRVLKLIFGPKGMSWQESRGNCVMKSFMICSLRQV
jgi:hypothetical protein